MSLRKTIRRVLKEEESKDLTNLMTKLVDSVISQLDPDGKYVCDYEIRSPKFHGEIKYKMIVGFNSGPNSPNWPRTQAVNYREEAILNEIQDYILNYLGVYVQMWSTTKHC